MDGIRASRVFLVLLSEASGNSPHVRREVERASNLGKTVLPVRIQDIEPHGPIEYFVGSRQWIDAFPDLESGVPEIARAVGGTGSSVAETPTRPPPSPRATPPPWLISAVAIGAVLIAFVIVTLTLTGGSDTNGGASPPATGSETEPSAVTTAMPDSTTSTTAGTTTTTGGTAIPNPPIGDRFEGWSVLLAESFDGNDRGWTIGERTDDNGTQVYRLEGGTYSIRLSGNSRRGSYFSTVDVAPVSPVGLSATFSLVERDAIGRCGIAVQLVSEVYLLVGYSEQAGRASVWYFDEEGPSQLLDAPAAVERDAPARLTVLIEPGRAELSVDGVFSGEVADARIGAIDAAGVSAQFSDDLICLFDDLEVLSP